MMVLWLLMLRAIGIEFRTHVQEPVWQGFFDTIFGVSSILLAIFFGAALGNVVRGVPLNSDGYFFEPLWTNFRVGPQPGILDWYTVMAGVVALVALASHGALYIAAKTEAGLNQRARQMAACAWWALLVLTPVSLVATVYVRPHMLANYKAQPLGYLIPLDVCGSLVLMAFFRARTQDRKAFASSCAYIAGMLAGAAFGIYPYVLPATTDPSYSLTIYNTAAGQHGLRVGLVWWILGMALVLGYFRYLYGQFRGKVTLEQGGDGGHGGY